MRTQRRGGREILGIVLLFGVFLAFALYSERVAQETVGTQVPSMYNAQSGGVKALNLLLEQQGYRVADLRSPWSALVSSHGLLIVVEPFAGGKDRAVSKEELEALSRWVNDGGHLLYLVTAPARPLDPSDPLTGDLAVIGVKDSKSTILPPSLPAAPLMENIRLLRLGSPVRLDMSFDAEYVSLLSDAEGDLIVEKTVGKGNVVVVASTALATNAGIADADNALLLTNMAMRAVGDSGKTILFDEYHHGLGLTTANSAKTRSLMALTPLGWKLAALHLALLMVILIYNGNRLFGRPRRGEVPPHRSSVDYIGGMARLYRRAGATEIAVGTLHQAFVRDLTSAMLLTPDAPIPEIVERARRRFGVDADALHALLSAGAAALNGQRVSEPEMLRLCEQYDVFRRKLDLAGTA
jgi:hypothetical protein